MYAFSLPFVANTPQDLYSRSRLRSTTENNHLRQLAVKEDRKSKYLKSSKVRIAMIYNPGQNFLDTLETHTPKCAYYILRYMYITTEKLWYFYFNSVNS